MGQSSPACPGIGAKLKPEDIDAYLRSLPKAVKQMPPKALSISQVTECGMVYGLDEIAALGAGLPRARPVLPHGRRPLRQRARVARLHPAEMTWKRGVDILSFGATKNGCLMAEAIVVFRPDLAEALDYRAKRAGQIISKGRLIAAQFEGYFGNDHWLDNARHANRMAQTPLGGACPPSRRAGSRGRRRPTRCSRSSRKTLDGALKAAGILYNPWTELSLPRDRAGGGSTRS